MDNGRHLFSCSRNWMAFGLLFVIVFTIYSNTFDASWHLDDYANITMNKRLHLTDLKTESLLKTLYADPDGGNKLNKMYRPVACLTLALNWYLGRENVTGYHIVNIAIHIFCTFFLFLTVMAFYDTPRLKSKFRNDAYFVALLSAVLWAVNPIQTQAVTYIVQRMASLAALFYITGIYFYLKGRNAGQLKYAFLYYTGCTFVFLLAIGSKENTIILPLALILIEILFYQDLTLPETRKKICWVLIIGGLLIAIGGSLFFLPPNPFAFLQGYDNRSFSMSERLLTEPRVITFYLSQIFYPIANRFSIEHDFLVSSSLFKPWTTLPAIIFLICLITSGIIQMKKRPFISLAVLFFFLNHLIESTIFPLELVFEHRNYLPSLFLFLPVSVGLKKMVDNYQRKKRFIYLIISAFIVCLLTAVSLGTYTRNFVWASEKTLWQDTIKKAPNRARPFINIASKHFEKIGDFDKAFFLFQKALELDSSTPRYYKSLCLNNMAVIYSKWKRFEEAIPLFQEAIKNNPKYGTAQYNLLVALLNMGKWDLALEHSEKLIQSYSESDYFNLKGAILLNQGRLKEALICFKQSLYLNAGDWKTYLGLGVAYSMLGEVKKAEHFMVIASRINPLDILPLFYIIENSLDGRQKLNTDIYLETLFSRLSLGKIRFELEQFENNKLFLPASKKLLEKHILSGFQKRVELLDEF